MDTRVFFRTDIPEIKEIVDRLGDVVNEEDLEKVNNETLKLTGDNPMPLMTYELCTCGSAKFEELSKDRRYTSKKYT